MERVIEVIAWYQQKIGAYDKQLWEKSVEQKVLKKIQYVPKKAAKVNLELIDVDLVRGSTFTKAKPQHGWLEVTRKGLARVIFFPFYYRWWREQTTGWFSAMLLLLYACQLTVLLIYWLDTGNNVSSELLSLAHLITPLLLMLILGIVHSQIIANQLSHRQTHSSSHKRRTKQKRRKLRPRFSATDPDDLTPSTEDHKESVSHPGSGNLPSSQTDEIKDDLLIKSSTNLDEVSQRIVNPDKHKHLNGKVPSTSEFEGCSSDLSVDRAVHCDIEEDGTVLYTQCCFNARPTSKTAGQHSNNIGTLQSEYCDHSLGDVEDNLACESDTSGKNGKSLLCDCAPMSTPYICLPGSEEVSCNSNETAQVLQEGIGEVTGELLLPDPSTQTFDLSGGVTLQCDGTSEDTAKHCNGVPLSGPSRNIEKQMFTSQNGASNLRHRSKGKAKVPELGSVTVCERLSAEETRQYSDSRCRSEGQIHSTHQGTDLGNNDSNKCSTVHNRPTDIPLVDSLTVSSCESDGETTPIIKGQTSEIEWEESMNTDVTTCSDSSSDCSTDSATSENPNDHRQCQHVSSVMKNLASSNDKVSCTIWEMEEPKKADLTVLDVGYTIIQKVDRIPENSDYLGLGVIFSLLEMMLPLVFRAYNTKGQLSELNFFSIDGITTFFFTVFGSNWREQAVVINGTVQRLCLCLIFFFLLSVGERTFKQRLLYAKHFCYLTSSRRAKKYELPHFRLNKVRNIRTWLSLRSYLKKRGPQRSVDTIVSAAFILGVTLVSIMCVELLQDSGGFLDHLGNWELVLWCMALGIYLLRFMTLGAKINRKYRNFSVLITEQINLYLHMEQKPHKKEELMLANNVLKLAEDLLKELESPFKVSGMSANPFLYNITKVIILSAFSAVLTELLGFKLKLYKIKIRG